MNGSEKKREKNIQRCVDCYKRIYPQVRDPLNHADRICVDDLAHAAFSGNSLLLDAGCGKENNMHGRLSATIVGIDLKLSSLAANKDLSHTLCGSVLDLPFKDSTFDAVYSRWVIEHIPDPKKLINEYQRVLKKKGKLLLVTTNVLNPAVLFSKIIPHGVAKTILNKLNYQTHDDIFPTFYRANTISIIKKLFSQSGITLVSAHHVGYPFYFHQKYFLFRLAMMYERMTDILILKRFKMHLAIIGEKK